MNLLMLGALAGGFSGAFGFFLAGKFHGNDKGEKLYPIYSATFFGLIVLATKFLT
ncbi:hypothetical protein C8D79_2814 [Bacteriovorax stolpii]|uniref:hypothetical protein n=1 Tax=Bacteriovorax stolpii TaxID=960 RepID=UPI0010EB4C97|nr:hypothetical protein [Bacteriovorax stolpii]TDP52164.1 hypothetical protein C8D79_2814 [Bacteriovorax stolpii]